MYTCTVNWVIIGSANGLLPFWHQAITRINADLLSALLQLHLHSRLNTWVQWIGRRQLQDETHLSFGVRASCIRDFTVRYKTLLSWICFQKCLHSNGHLVHPLDVRTHFSEREKNYDFICTSLHFVRIWHYNDVIMGAIASQITILMIVYSGSDQRKHESSASLAFVRGIYRGPVNSPHKWTVTWKMFPFDDVIMDNNLFHPLIVAWTKWSTFCRWH